MPQLPDSLTLKRLTYNRPDLVRALPQSKFEQLTLRVLKIARVERIIPPREISGLPSEVFIPMRFELSWIYIYPRIAIKKRLSEDLLQERAQKELRNRHSTLKRTTFPPRYWDRVRVAMRMFGAKEVVLSEGDPVEVVIVDAEIPLDKILHLGPRLEIDLLKRIVNRFKISIHQRAPNSIQRYYRSIKLVVEDWLHLGETKESWKGDIKATKESLWMKVETSGEELVLPFTYFEVARKVPKRLIINKSPDYTVVVRKGIWPTTIDNQNRVLDHLSPMVPRVVEWTKELVPLEWERIFNDRE